MSLLRCSRSLLPALAVALTACGDDGTSPAADASVTPDASGAPDAAAPPDAGEAAPRYEFDSRFAPGTSSVAYTGQVFRQVLIAEMAIYLEALTAKIDDGTLVPQGGEIEQALRFYYEFDPSTGGEVPLALSTTPPLLHATYAMLSAGGANLKAKTAGNDASTDHEDWATAFRGWSEGGPTTPEQLLLGWFAQLDDLAVARAAGTIPTGPDGKAIGKVYVTAKGQDLRQLSQKFLLGALAFSQAADDYLDSADAGKGLKSTNTRDTDKPYTVLEHAWDEGFGYFGAARDMADYTDEEVAGRGGRDGYKAGYHDTSGDGKIDLRSELNFGGAATNAAKRDADSKPGARTDYSQAIFGAFVRGRQLIASIDGELSPAQLAQLEAERDTIVDTWELALAASVIHYINATLRDMGAFGTDTYKFLDHAKHWSEMKGFALGFQFSPFMKLTDAQFLDLHDRLGDAPVLPDATPEAIAAYKTDLLAARELLATVYGFDAANVGDADGKNGW